MEIDTKVKYREALLVRCGRLMHPDWRDEEESHPSPKKKAKKTKKTSRKGDGDDTPVPVLEEANFRPLKTQYTVRKESIHGYDGSHSALEEYREVADRLEQKERPKVLRSDYEAKGADLLPILDTADYGETYPSGSFLWADLRDVH